MKEFKFRAWNDPLKKMDYSNLNAIGFDGRIYYGNTDLTGFYNDIMQFTGMKDVEGQEIYEGDVVIFSDHLITGIQNRKGIVEFQDGSFIINDGSIKHYRWLDYVVQVFGNKYEMPDWNKEGD